MEGEFPTLTRGTRANNMDEPTGDEEFPGFYDNAGLISWFFFYDYFICLDCGALGPGNVQICVETGASALAEEPPPAEPADFASGSGDNGAGHLGTMVPDFEHS